MRPNVAIAELAHRVGAFHITERTMKRAQTAFEAALADGTVDEPARRAYLDAVQRYFEGFTSEARTHLRDVDRRLEQTNQVHFNLTAERGVAVKRIEATEAVLADVAALRESPGA